MSDATKNFTLRLSADDQARLEQLATRLRADRTGALRLLIRRAVPCLTVSDSAIFIPVSRQRSSSAPLPICLQLKGRR